MKPERVVLALSGGGMKAMAHLGVYRALAEGGLRPTGVVGTSTGALVGALIAAGTPYEAMVRFAVSIRREDVAAPARGSLLMKGVGAESALKGGPLKALVERALPGIGFDDLVMSLRITAVDMDRGSLEVFGAAGRTDATLQEAIYASMALPVYLPPARIGGRRLGDGGVLQLLPIELALDLEPDLVVAVDVGPVAHGPPAWHSRPPRLVEIHDRAMTIMMADQRARVLAGWGTPDRPRPGRGSARPPLVLVRPEVDPHATFVFDRTVEFIEAGYRAARRALETLAPWPAPGGG